jgi:hypothetical protein
MSERSLGERFMDLVKDNAQRIGPEIGAVVEHQIGRGATELANALFNGQGFVLYGHGSSHPANVDQLDKSKEPGSEVHQPEISQSKGIHM